MRKLLVLSLLLLLVGQAQGFEYSNRWVHYVDGIESLTFQQGVSPSAVYDGCTDTYLDGAAATTNRDTGSLVVNSTDAVPLIRFDISAIPDSAVVHYAELRLTMTAETWATGQDGEFGIFRMMRGWTENQATWTVSKTDTSWTGAGATDGNLAIIQFLEIATREVDTQLGNYDATWARYDQLTIGADSLQHGYDSGGIMDYCCLAAPYSSFRVQVDGGSAEGTDAPKRCRADVTTLVRGWHSGAWDNFGIKIVDWVTLIGADVTFADSENATAALRPELIVYYLYATTSTGSTGSGGVVTGAGVDP